MKTILIKIIIINLCVLCCFCHMEEDSKKQLTQEDHKRIVRIDLRSRNPLVRVRYSITRFEYMWKAASYSTVIESSDTLRLIDSLIDSLSNQQDSEEWRPVNLTAGMIITRANESKDSIAFGGGIAYKGRLYTYEKNRELVSILSKQLPYVESLLWQVLLNPNDTILRQKLDDEMTRFLTQGDSTK
jgi:hypothetical protein